MGGEQWQQVLDEKRIEREGRPYAWTIPLSLPVSDDEASKLSAGGSAALCEEEGGIVAVLDEIEVFDWDKQRYVREVYGTDRFDHPGGRAVQNDSRRKLIGGRLRALPQALHPEYGQYMLSPCLTRAFIRERKWERALAFQTRNPLHRAHEYALVAAAERLTREGHFTGVVLNPLVGELKGDDVPAATRMRCYRILHDQRLLGQGDQDEALWKERGYDLADVFELIGLDIKMFYGGPSEAVMHAIYRQNLGFTHFIIGRKHADAPFDDKTPIWGDFDAQEIFDNLEGELSIRTTNVGFAAYFEELGRVGLVAENKDKTAFNISGTDVRRILNEGEMPDERVMRPSTAKVLVDYYASQN